MNRQPTWFSACLRVLLSALALSVVLAEPAHAGKKHPKPPNPNGGLYQAPAPMDNPGRITAIEPPILSTDPGSPFAPTPLHPTAQAKADSNQDPAPEAKRFVIGELRIPSLFR